MVLAQIVAIACFVVAGVAWIVALLSALAMSKRGEPGRGLLWLMMNGRVFFTGKGFTAAAKPYRRRFLAAAAIFFFSLLLGVVIIALFLSQQPVSG